jgi:hypothetical protein
VSNKSTARVFAMRIRLLPNTDVIRELRWILKTLLRQHRFRCESIQEETPTMHFNISQLENQWQDKATNAAIAAARKLVLGDKAIIPMNTPIGRLSDNEWGWVVCAIIFAWISTRAEQATAEGLSTEMAVRLTGLHPDPWDAGAVATILPELAEAKIDWSGPLAEWPPEDMVDFLARALGLIQKATVARDLGGGSITRKPAAVEVRELNAAAGNPLMTPDEFADEVPFIP